MMFKKFMLCVFLCGLWNTEPIFGMMKEELPHLKEVARFEKKAVTQESLIFKTKKDDGSDDTLIVYTPSINNKRITIIKKNEDGSIANVDKKNTVLSYKAYPVTPLDNITKYANIAQQNGSVYTFYVAIKIPKKHFFEKDTYSIQKVDFNQNTKELTGHELFTHDSPIVHMGIIKQGQHKYLVTGSLYPSIKICDLQTYKPFEQPLHNRFLLGCMGNTIMYAKKETRPWTGVGRYLDSKNQPFNCLLYYLQGSFDKKDEKRLGNNTLQINNSLENYPIIAESNSSICFWLINRPEKIYAFIKEEPIITLEIPLFKNFTQKPHIIHAAEDCTFLLTVPLNQQIYNMYFIDNKNKAFLNKENMLDLKINLSGLHAISHIFYENGMLYVFDQTGLYTINVKQQMTTLANIKQKEIEEERLKSRVYQEKKEQITQTVKAIIDEITSDQTIDNLKNAFNEALQFTVNTQDDIMNDANFIFAILPILQVNLIAPILYQEISTIVNKYSSNQSLLNVNAKEYLINELTRETGSQRILLQGVHNENIVDALNEKQFIGKEINGYSKEYLKKYLLSETFKNIYANIKTRFPELLENIESSYINFKTEEAPQYLNTLGALSFYLALETQKINVEANERNNYPAITNKTYFEYAKSKIIDNANNIKTIKLDIEKITHTIANYK